MKSKVKLPQGIKRSSDKDTIEPQATKSKMGNRALVVDGIRYDSVAEHERHIILKTKERLGEIFDLRYHDKNDKIVILDDPIIRYEPDFCYTLADGTKIVEDVKGFQTDVFKIKKKMVISMLRKGDLPNTRFVLVKKAISKGRVYFKTIEEYSKDENIVHKKGK